MTYREGPRHSPVARVENDELHVEGGAVLPPVCLLCGTRKKLRTRLQTFTWRPASALRALGVLLGPLGMALTTVFERKCTVTVSFCDACDRRRLDASAASGFAGILALAAVIGAATAIFNDHLVVGAVVAVVAALACREILRRFTKDALQVVWIHSEGTVALRGVHVDAVRAAVERHEVRSPTGA